MINTIGKDNVIIQIVNSYAIILQYQFFLCWLLETFNI